MPKIFSYISEDEDKKNVQFEKSGVKKIKIVNSNFHNQITDHVTALISEQFLES